jgi:lysophospholipase L1-like esterase
MIKPSTTLRLFLLVSFIFISIEIFLPKQVNLFGGNVFKFISIKELFSPKKIEYASVDIIEKRLKATAKTTTIGNKKNKDFVADNQIPDSLDIQFPPGNDTVLNSFFSALKNIKNQKELIRVLHFGDSQIEGDRITGELRKSFQSKFGGCGTGILHLVDQLNVRHSHKLSNDDNWIKVAAYGYEKRKAEKQNFGILASYFKADKNVSQSEIEITKTYVAKINESKSEVFNIFSMNNTDTNSFSVFQNNIPLHKEKENYLQTSFALNTPVSNHIKIKIKNSTNHILQGISFDCRTGITFDNVPMRGSSGTEFTKINKELLTAQIKQLNTKLIILQFGVNIIPYILKDYSYYENLLYKQLMFLKQAAPNTPILLISVSDMSRKEGEVYVSYPNIELVRDAQRKAAFRAGCAFWDLFSNMGGKNAMPSWVNAEKPLANKDYTHFTNKGANYIGQLLYNTLINRYEQYNNQ